MSKEYNLTIFDLKEWDNGKHEYESRMLTGRRYRRSKGGLQYFSEVDKEWRNVAYCGGERFREIKIPKRYWQWKVRTSEGLWYSPETYYDENGMNTAGGRCYQNWDNLKKIKVEDDYIDIDG